MRKKKGGVEIKKRRNMSLSNIEDIVLFQSGFSCTKKYLLKRKKTAKSYKMQVLFIYDKSAFPQQFFYNWRTI